MNTPSTSQRLRADSIMRLARDTKLEVIEFMGGSVWCDTFSTKHGPRPRFFVTGLGKTRLQLTSGDAIRAIAHILAS
jgi:hypothetical protein